MPMKNTRYTVYKSPCLHGNVLQVALSSKQESLAWLLIYLVESGQLQWEGGILSTGATSWVMETI